jgi:hypothetical protein
MTSLEHGKHQRLDAELDKLRVHYGRRVVYFGGVQDSRGAGTDAHQLYPHPGSGG